MVRIFLEMKAASSAGLVVAALGLFLLPAVRAQYVDTLEVLLKEGQEYVEKGEYGIAVSLYTALLERNDVVPAQMSYFFGKALYHLHRLREADRFLRFYKARASSEDPRQPAATSLLLRLQVELSAIEKCSYCDTDGYRYQTHLLCKGQGYLEYVCATCRGYRYMVCTYCYRQGVLISTDVFSKKSYSSCPYCKGQGWQNCSRCQGKGHTRTACQSCGQSGKTISSQLCNHTDKP